MKCIFFIDLDNTIYFTKPNEEVLMRGLYQLLEKEDLGVSDDEFQAAKAEMLRTPFQKVAHKYGFKEKATANAVAFLANRQVEKPLIPSKDYHYIKSLAGRKFIVTAGFPKQQLSKVKMLEIGNDFEGVYVVDVSKTNKKEVFEELIKEYNLNKEEILIIGDDADSEIKFGLELGIETFLLDPDDKYTAAKTTYRGTDFSNLHASTGQI